VKVVRANEIEPFEGPDGNATTGLATPSRGAGEVSVIRQRQRPGGSNPLHHHDREEVMALLAGSVTVVLDGERHVLSAGDAIVVPAGTVHRVENAGDETAEWLILSSATRRFFTPDGDRANPVWAG
jgi:quercetin dioxygenase-like cupin family protein